MREEWEEEGIELEPSKLKGAIFGVGFAVFIAAWLLVLLQVAGVVEIYQGGVGMWAEW